ncbi:MAG: tetratricopeptide repeat protein [Nitrospinota bacterium]
MGGFFKSFFGGAEEKEEDHFDLGMAGWKGGNYEDAITHFNEAIQKDPKNAETHFNRANAKLKLKRFDDALKDYDKAIQLDPNSAKSYSNRGYIMETLGRPAEAVTDYSEAIRIKPNFSVTYLNRGKVRFKLDHIEEALADFDKALSLNPKYSRAYYYRGRIKSEMGKRDEAIKDYGEAVRHDPKNARAYFFRGAEKVSKGWMKDAIADLDAAIRLEPKYPQAFFKRAGAKNKLGHKKEALKDLDEAIRMDKKNTGAYYARANIRFAQKKYKDAKKDFSKAIRLDPNFAWAYYGRSAAKMAEGNRGGGIRDLEIFVQLTEGSYQQSGKVREEAMQYLESLKKPASAAGRAAVPLPGTEGIPIEAAAIAEAKEPGIKEVKFEAILFIDICDSTAIIDSYGSNHFQKILKAVDGPLNGYLKKYECLYQKSTGDGYMLCFDKCINALNLSILLLQAMDSYNRGTSDNLKCDMRIGIDCGQVNIREDNSDRVGDAANVAKRIEGLSKSSFVELAKETTNDFTERNRVFISAKVLTMIGERDEFKEKTVGWAELKGKIGVRYRIHEILWRESTPITPGAASGSIAFKV